MKRTSSEFKSLLEVVTYCADEKRAFEYFRDRRWPSGVSCPRCGSDRISFIDSRSIWRCNGCKRQFSVKVGTIFEDSPISLTKWLPAMWLIGNAKNGISSYELHRALEVTQKTAWFMLHRIRLAMQSDAGTLMDHVEVDETYIGGKARNMHKHVKEQKITGTGGKDKSIVVGLLERGSSVKAQVVEGSKKGTLHNVVVTNVLKGSNLYTDAHRSYNGLGEWYAHQVIDHAVSYVDGVVHTNGLENFWSLLKRTVSGTYVSVEPFHLHRYLDEQTFRFNQRKDTDGERFELLGSQVAGKRLTYSKLTGKELAAAAF